MILGLQNSATTKYQTQTQTWTSQFNIELSPDTTRVFFKSELPLVRY